MTMTGTMSRTGEDPSPARELQAEIAGFVDDFKAFADDIQMKIKQQDARMTRLDRKHAAFTQRPALSAAEPEAPHQKAFSAYLRSGEDAGLRGLDLEGKAMSTAVGADGGFLVSPRTAETIAQVLLSTASIRAVASIVNVESASFDVLVDRGDIGAGWATETAAAAETGTGTLEKISIPLHELAALPKVSQRLLDDSAFDVEGWLAARIAEKFARSEAAAFVAGNGVDKPRGFLDYPKVANGAWAWGSLGYVAGGHASALAATDPLVEMVYALGAAYRAGASWVMNSKTAGVLRKLKDADGRYLWSDGLSAGEPARLLGYPVLVAEDMPDVAAGAHPVAFGNFSAGYTIAERPDLRVLRDPFSAKPNVLFYATKRVGGAVSDFAAIKLLRIATA